MARRILVTGASGFVGAVLSRRLLADGHEVHLLVRPGTDLWRLHDVDAPRHRIDLGDGEGLRHLVHRIRPEWVFHLAAHGAYPSQTDGRRMVLTNLLGTMALVEACLDAGVETIVTTGTSSEYGFREYPPDESSSLEPASEYAVTKASATLFCRYAAGRSGIPIPTLRLYSVYGPFEEPSRFVPTLATLGLEKRLPPLAAPEIARDFVFTEDVVAAYVLAAAGPHPEPGAVYNVGTGRQVTLGEAVFIARTTLGIEAEPRWRSMPARRWDTTTWVANPAKIRAVLGWTPSVGFEEGFRRLASWLAEDEARRRFYRERIAPAPQASRSAAR